MVGTTQATFTYLIMTQPLTFAMKIITWMRGYTTSYVTIN